jgi:putative NADH-flavin reductase
MQIALFGATGKTGRLVLDDSLSRGWQVRALVRDKAKLPARDGLSVVQGDARSTEPVVDVLSGSAATLCCLSMHDVSVPATDFSYSVRCIVGVMREKGLRRVLAIASGGVLDHPQGGYRNKEGLPPYLTHVSAEHVRNYETLRDSGLDWTLMCPLFLKEDIPVGHAWYAFEDLPAGSDETGYRDLAITMTSLVEDPRSFGKTVGIVSVR